jgi:hypothetical protein
MSRNLFSFGHNAFESERRNVENNCHSMGHDLVEGYQRLALLGFLIGIALLHGWQEKPRHGLVSLPSTASKCAWVEPAPWSWTGYVFRGADPRDGLT